MTFAYDAPGRNAVRHLQDYQRAQQEVASILPSTFGMDSAEAVYGAALEVMGVDTSDLARHPAALRPVFLARCRGGAAPRIAMDSASHDERAKRFPNGDRLGRVA